MSTRQGERILKRCPMIGFSMICVIFLKIPKGLGAPKLDDMVFLTVQALQAKIVEPKIPLSTLDTR
ncbi:uncharacterized protein BJX67DRAFT_341124 [Aspergillus lucknowensis]|uniref:Uncharacterized protein n=1 Tax=Aspergillus lucknowensis TaxID=176173 RepID=A0ABR4M5U0_9EURO